MKIGKYKWRHRPVVWFALGVIARGSDRHWWQWAIAVALAILAGFIDEEGSITWQIF